MPVTRYYHVRDPMENLLLRVTLRKVAGSDTENAIAVGKRWQESFQWQEKKPKFREEENQKSKGKGGAVGESSQIQEDTLLSSYVDADDFLPNEVRHPVEISLTTSKDRPTHLLPPDLSRRPRNKRTQASWTPNQHRAWLRANREDQFRAMHIVALIDGVERVLCSFRFYKESGLFCATPGFSMPIVEPEHDPDLVMKGPKLTTYYLTTHSGSVYEYALENAHDLFPFVSIEDQEVARRIRLEEDKRDRMNASQWHQISKNLSTFEQKSGDSKVSSEQIMMISLEVVTVDNLPTTDPIYVEFELDLPRRPGFPHWKSQPGDHTHGKTSLSLLQPSAYPAFIQSAGFNHHQRFNLTLVKAEQSLVTEVSSPMNKDDAFANLPPSPMLHLSVFSRDSWQRKRSEGHGEVKVSDSSGFFDLDVPLQKSIFSIGEQMEELFLGIDESVENDDVVRNRMQDCEVHLDESPISTLISSRLGQKSTSTGATIRIRYNLVTLQPKIHHDNAARLAFAPPTLTAISSKVAKRSVQEILRSVKLEKRLSTITDSRIQAALRSLSIPDI